MCGWWGFSRKEEKRAYGLKIGFFVEGTKHKATSRGFVILR